MTPEDKDLLLRDLCSRLPYGVKVHCECARVTLIGDIITLDIRAFDKFFNKETEYVPYDILKPYLFPMSSMTEEQKKEYYSLADDVTIKPEQGCYLGIKIHCIKLGISDNPHEEVWDYINLDALDWLNKNHFDYRGLIEKGLAIDCSNLNIY